MDSMLSQKRDMKAAIAFFKQAAAAVGQIPERATTDGHDAYPRAIAEVLGPGVQHRVSDCHTSRIEQDHRGIKQRYYPMLGFSAFEPAKQFCQAFDEVRNFFRPRQRMRQLVSISTRREKFVTRVQQLQEGFQAA